MMKLVLRQGDNYEFSELGSGWAQGTSRRQWHVLAQRRNTANDRFPARPKGGTQMSQYGVTALKEVGHSLRSAPCLGTSGCL